MQRHHPLQGLQVEGLKGEEGLRGGGVKRGRGGRKRGVKEDEGLKGGRR